MTALFLISQLSPDGVFALTVSEEEKLARSFIKYIRQRYEIVEDPLIVGYVNSVGNRIVAGLKDPIFDYKFMVLSHNTIRGAAGGAILCAELMEARGFLD